MSRFDPIDVNDEADAFMDDMMEEFQHIEAILDERLPRPSRERALAITALEEAAHWLNRAIALTY